MIEYTVKVYDNGRIEWFVNDVFHREDGPAVEFPHGRKDWWINGVRHSEDGPAIKYNSGEKYWFLNDKLHREDGPAVEMPDGKKEWHIDGKELTEQEFLNRTAPHKIVIDNKTIGLSEESYQEFKNSLT